MANQQPRPAWFRLSSLAGRAPAPAPARPPAPAPAPARPPVPVAAPAPAPARPPVPAAAPVRPPVPTAAPARQPAPVPATVRPSIPSRPVVPPMQTQETAPPQPQSLVAAPPAPAPAPPPPPSPPPPAPVRSPVAPAPSPRLPSPAAPQPSQPRAGPESTRPSPPVPGPAAAPAPQSSRSPTPTPAPATKSPLQRSPTPRETSTTSTDAPPAPPSPKTKTKAALSSPMPTSPIPKAAETINGKATATLMPSPQVVKPLERTPGQSPTLKPASHPPSPFTLPPAQVAADGDREPESKIDQKNVLLQQSIDKPMNKYRAHNSAVPSNGKREPTMKDKAPSKKAHDFEELGIRMITLAGENKGAVMELTPSHKKTYFAGNPHSVQKQQAGIKSGTSNGDQSTGENDEGKSGSKDKTNWPLVTMQSPMKASLNSNVQGLNNSILFNSTFRNNDPGIHLTLTRKTNGGGGGRTRTPDK